MRAPADRQGMNQVERDGVREGALSERAGAAMGPVRMEPTETATYGGKEIWKRGGGDRRVGLAGYGAHEEARGARLIIPTVSSMTLEATHVLCNCPRR